MTTTTKANSDATITLTEVDWATGGTKDTVLTLMTSPLTRGGYPLLLVGDWVYHPTDAIDPSLGQHRNAAYYLYHIFHVVNHGEGLSGDLRTVQDFIRAGMEAR